MSRYSHIPLWDAYSTLGVDPAAWDAVEGGHLNELIRLGRIRVPVADDRKLVAYVSDNRWVATCLVCNGGIPVAQDRERWTCWDCGTSYVIEWPTAKEGAAAVEALRERIPRLRNWTPGVESVDLLVEQNETLGLDHHSWTTPRTWISLELVTASTMNTHIRDNFNETAPAKVTTEGDLLLASGANAIARLAEGANNEYLRVISGTVQWST